MKPKEKAIDLVGKMHSELNYIQIDQARECAIIAVEEIIYALNVPPIQNDSMLWKSQNEYWHEVKIEIEKL